MTAGRQMIATEFIALPEPPVGRPRLMLVEGELVVNQPGALHGHVQTNLLLAIETWARAAPERGWAVFPRDIGIDDRNVYAPDVLWYSHDRVPDPLSPAPYTVPDLAIEVRSPSTWRYDIGAKKAGYERHGLPELWLVDTESATVLVYRRSSPESRGFDIALEISEPEQLRSLLLPGFTLSLTEVFRLP
ncbi:MAG: Uma2 family endonuclease [Thermoleophilaceae bacterium]